MATKSSLSTRFPYTSTTLVDVLQFWAKELPDKTVFIFLKDGEHEEVRITFQELDRQARLIAARLQQLRAEGERVLLLYPPGLEYIAAFFGCLYSGAIAVPAYPPRLNRPVPRIQAIVADCEATFALTTPEILSNMEQRFEYTPDLAQLQWVNTEELPEEMEDEWHKLEIEPTDLAFLQYTSGSTSTPKGVMLSHRNLLHNLEQISIGFQLNEEEIGISWLPSYHDMGLIGTVLGTIYIGGTTVLLAPLDFLQRPLRWLQAIAKYKATASGGPNFAYDICVEKIKPEVIESLDLRSWRIAFSGAEPVRLETMRRFAKTFEPCGFRWEAFYPCYGLAEATLFVTGGEGSGGPVTYSIRRSALERDFIEEVNENDEDALVMVGCGTKKLEQEIAIVNPDELRRCETGEVGEIWVCGESVARGYWKRPEENQNTFNAMISDGDLKTYLRTGDLGFLKDGELFITGRLKDLIIIRGSNHYPQDIELTVEGCHEAMHVAGGGAFSIDVGDEERLVVVHEIDRQYRRSDLAPAIQAIRRAVAENHDLQVYAIALIKPFTIPKTSSGKIKRHACKAMYLNGELDVITEWRASD